ncbi:MAG: response regulator [Gallionella sp.]|nr:response regulator [Gallionella sp.]
MTEQTNPSGTQPEILIVEDSAVEAEMLRRCLDRAGYRVTVAKNGEEGLQAARVRRPALIMSDINMPVMDGFRLCRAIKYDDDLWNIPLILLTMLSEPEDIIEAINSGADAYIIKPFAEANLLDRIRSLLDAPLVRRRTGERRQEVVGYGGKRYDITGGGQQILNLLLSVYENTLFQNRDLTRIQNQLNLLNDNLDEKVRERTAALQESEQQFMQLFMQIPIPLAVVNTEGVMTHVNNRYTKVLGYTHDDVPTLQEWWQRAYPDEAYRRWVLDTWNAAVAKAAKEGVDIEPIEYRVVCKSGAERIMLIGGMTLKDNLLATLVDITERKQAESQLNEQIEELRRWHEATLGMGMRNIELKREVNELLGQAGQPPRYHSVEAGAAAEGSPRSSGEPTGVPLAGEQSNAELGIRNAK